MIKLNHEITRVGCHVFTGALVCLINVHGLRREEGAQRTEVFHDSALSAKLLAQRFRFLVLWCALSEIAEALGNQLLSCCGDRSDPWVLFAIVRHLFAHDTVVRLDRVVLLETSGGETKLTLPDHLLNPFCVCLDLHALHGPHDSS